MNQLEHMRTLIEKIKLADEAYYKNDTPIMTDREYDEIIIELKMLEKITGIKFNDSPIGKIPSDAKEGLKTERHTKPMLSAKKTKDIDEFAMFIRKKDSVISWKLDGLTLVLRYKQGNFVQALTRGKDGLEGEDITHNVKEIRSIPMRVSCKEDFEVRGEGVISWKDYEFLSKFTDKTTHPRNMVSGMVRSYIPDIGKLSHLDFVAFELIKEKDEPQTKVEQLKFLSELGFSVVEHFLVKDAKIEEIKEFIENWEPEEFNYPVDGIITEYNDMAYGRSLGATAHHEKRMLAFKWADELKETYFRGVKLHTTRTGKVSITALFDPVIIDGTKFSRASLHTLENFRNLRLGIGDIITVYKANRIVPQVAENKMLSGTYELPRFCPSCGEELIVKHFDTETEYLYCPNEDCVARNAAKITAFCNAMGIGNITATKMEDLIAYGYIGHFKDIFHLELYEDEIRDNPKLGGKWYNEVIEHINTAKKTYMHNFIHALGIPRVGKSVANALHTYYYGDIHKFIEALNKKFAFSHIEGVSEAAEEEIYKWFGSSFNMNMFKELMAEVEFYGVSKAKKPNGNPFEGKKVAISGTYKHFDINGMRELLSSLRAQVREKDVEKADYLVYGSMPNSEMLAEAIKNSVTLISEDSFVKMLEQNL